MDEILRRFDEVDARLVAAGFPATSPWWRKTIERWYRSGKRFLVSRVGRRGGKSSTLSRLAVVEALYGQHVVPPGDIGYVAIISIDRGEALGRLRLIEAILDALGIAWKPCKAPIVGIEVVDRRVGFRVFTASIGGVSGFTAVFVLCDECAKWRDKETGANPATEVIRSVRPTMRTQPNARGVLSSSPFGMLDAHYDAFELGETDGQVVAHAPTWVANPTITEAETRADEPDEATWEREYAAIPQAEVESSLLTEYLVDRATRPLEGDLEPADGCYYVAAMDPATRGHAWTLVVATQDHRNVRHIVLAREWRGTPKKPLDPGLVLAEMAGILAPYNVNRVVTDQRDVDSLRTIARERGLGLTEAAWTPATKRDGFEGLLKLLQAQRVTLPPGVLVKTDLLGIVKKLTRNGVTYELTEKNGRHSDFAPAIALAVMDARYAGEVPDDEKTETDRAEERKRAFLEGRKRERERSQKRGRLPVTHRVR